MRGMSPRVLRRKLQKKKKHRPYGVCPKCGDRTARDVVGSDGAGWRLVGSCWGGRCGVVEELFWTG
jgi:hypothetical protein